MFAKINRMLDKYGLTKDEGVIRAFWWEGGGKPNFGDIITPYLIKKITGKSPRLCNGKCFSEYHIMVGSVMEYANKHAVIWGTGIMNRKQDVKKPKKIYAVRGPISRKRMLELGYECPEIYGDPGLLLPKFYDPPIDKKYAIGVIPHYVDYEQVKSRIRSDKVLLIDVMNSVETVVDQIKSCKCTVSSSLHGVIVSQAYGIPSVWVQFSDKLAGDGTKYRDYFLSVKIEPYQGIDLSQGELRLELLEDCALLSQSKIDIDLDLLLEVFPLSNNNRNTNTSRSGQSIAGVA
ncbi:polysaccharide pyruvyl transferase family protein [Desulfocapsa sp. AH-315-G09]|nr:polysaccharide pyruvyl transferase family protein [Desulfocapsa sp. AH-315-G09]